MTTLGWIAVIWLACTIAVAVMLARAPKHAPRDPSELVEDTFPEAWLWPAREPEDSSSVRHGGLGR